MREALRSAFAARGIQACDAGEDAIAALELGREEDAVTVTVEIWDAVTQKRVQRVLDVAGFTADSRALAIAIAADELLIASWAELSLAAAREPEEPPPAEVTEVVRQSLDPARMGPPPAPIVLSVGFLGTVFTGRAVLLGAATRLSLPVVDALAVRVGLEGALGLPEPARGGEVRTMYGAASAGVGWTVLSAGALGVALDADLVGGAIRFEGTADEGYAGDSAIRGLLVGRVGPTMRLTAAPWQMAFQVHANLPIVGAAAGTDTERQAGVYGAGMSAAVLVGVHL